MSSHARRASAANKILLAEFGPAPGTDQPMYKWAWSEELRWPVPECDESGAPAVDYHCACGVNKPRRANLTAALAKASALGTGMLEERESAIHAKFTQEAFQLLQADSFFLGASEEINFGEDPNHKSICPGIRTPRPRIRWIRLVDGYCNTDGLPILRQYALVRWIPPPSPQEWYRLFGKELDYDFHKNGFYDLVTSRAQVTGKNGVPLVVAVATGGEGAAPSVEDTRRFVTAVRESVANLEKARAGRDAAAAQRAPKIIPARTELNPASTPFYGAPETRQHMVDTLQRAFRENNVGRIISIPNGARPYRGLVVP